MAVLTQKQKIISLEELKGCKHCIKSGGVIYCSPAIFSLYSKEKGLALDALLRSLTYVNCDVGDILMMIKNLTT